MVQEGVCGDAAWIARGSTGDGFERPEIDRLGPQLQLKLQELGPCSLCVSAVKMFPKESAQRLRCHAFKRGVVPEGLQEDLCRPGLGCPGKFVQEPLVRERSVKRLRLLKLKLTQPRRR